MICTATQGCIEKLRDIGRGIDNACQAAGDKVRNWFAQGPKVSPVLEPNTNPPQAPVIPEDWVSRPGRNGGEIYYPPGTDPANGENIRVMPPGSTPVPGLNDGYWFGRGRLVSHSIYQRVSQEAADKRTYRYLRIPCRQYDALNKEINMYELPGDFDESVLLGSYLEMVCIGPYATNLHFSKPQITPGKSYSITICIKGSISIMGDGSSSFGIAENPKSMAPLVDLLMRDIASVQRIGKASLQISFKPDGYVILDGDGSPDFESYSIQFPGGDIVVV